MSAVTGVPRIIPEAVQPFVVLAETADGAVIVGLTLSITVTNCVAVVLFPEPSVTVHVTVVVPIGKEVGALFVTVATEQLSAVTGVPRLNPIAVHHVVVYTVIAAGATIVG